ncbi:MAG TPA: hypothetical protein VK154_14770 [Chitinophagales bacterium]|nr:hypothetical protein [Chitinophagales bacterium]
MKSLFHPPSVLFGCDHLSVTHHVQQNCETAGEVEHHNFNAPTIKMFIPLTPPVAQEPCMQKVQKPKAD